ncbi:Hsp70 family protein, partial [Vibrio alfacsensis]
SAVHYTEESTTVGVEARDNAASDPVNTIISVKRLLGRSLADVQSRYPSMPYSLTESDNGLPVLQTRGGAKNPIQVSSDILKVLS